VSDDSAMQLEGFAQSEITHLRETPINFSVFLKDIVCSPVEMGLDFDSAIDFSPVTDSHNINNQLPIIDAVNNPVVFNSDTPQVLFALQLT
jgi:hypothetical protein